MPITGPSTLRREPAVRTVGYGVIGLGFFGEKHAEVAAALPHVDLRAVCTRNDQRRKSIKKRLGVPRDYTDYQDLLADPQIEAVSIVTHIDDHLTPTLAALRAGKHVLLEKPMARTTAQCNQMINAAQRAKCILMVGHICRFNPRYAIARESILKGEIGRIVSMYARRNIPADRSKEVLDKIGPILGDAIHDTDLMLCMSQGKIISAFAQTHSVRQLKNPDVAWTTYRFQNGAIGTIETVWFLPQQSPFRIHEQLEIIGTDGALYLNGNDANLMIHGKNGFDCPDTLYWPEMHGQPIGALREEMAYFADCVAGGLMPTIVTPEEARDAVAAAAAAEKSAQSGRLIRI